MSSPRSRLRTFVEQSGAHVKDIARALGVSRSWLYALMEDDRSFPGRHLATAIEEMTGVAAREWDELWQSTRNKVA